MVFRCLLPSGIQPPRKTKAHNAGSLPTTSSSLPSVNFRFKINLALSCLLFALSLNSSSWHKTRTWSPGLWVRGAFLDPPPHQALQHQYHYYVHYIHGFKVLYVYSINYSALNLPTLYTYMLFLWSTSLLSTYITVFCIKSNVSIFFFFISWISSCYLIFSKSAKAKPMEPQQQYYIQNQIEIG